MTSYDDEPDDSTITDQEQNEHSSIIIDNLLKEFKTFREEIRLMIDDLEKIKSKVDSILPDDIKSVRVKFLFEEKVKSITELYKTLLDMRKEIGKSIKDEIEIRRKIKSNEEFSLDDLLDIRSMAKKVESFNDKSVKIKEKNNE